MPGVSYQSGTPTTLPGGCGCCGGCGSCPDFPGRRCGECSGGCLPDTLTVTVTRTWSDYLYPPETGPSDAHPGGPCGCSFMSVGQTFTLGCRTLRISNGIGATRENPTPAANFGYMSGDIEVQNTWPFVVPCKNYTSQGVPNTPPGYFGTWPNIFVPDVMVYVWWLFCYPDDVRFGAMRNRYGLGLTFLLRGTAYGGSDGPVTGYLPYGLQRSLDHPEWGYYIARSVSLPATGGTCSPLAMTFKDYFANTYDGINGLRLSLPFRCAGGRVVDLSSLEVVLTA